VRPNRAVYTIVHTFAGTYADLEIGTDGNISVIGPRPPAAMDLGFVSLEGITYPTNNFIGAIPVAPDWSANAGYGASTPAGWIDSYGVVHLQGAAKQIATGGNPWIIGTLPVGSLRPDRAVYTIVHTFAGTYADLEIGTDGNISVIGPRPPAAMDLGFVSLEGITYQQYQGSLVRNVSPAANERRYGDQMGRWVQTGYRPIA
jgi:hypothetical protein